MRKYRKAIIGGVFCGIGFALILAGVDWKEGKQFNLLNFILSASIFGIFEAVIIYNMKFQNKNK